MNKTEFVTVLAERYDMTKKDAAEMYDMVFGTFGELVAEGHEVAIAGVGKVSIVERSARTSRNPRTGEAIDVPAKKTPKFKFGKNIKEAVAEL